MKTHTKIKYSVLPVGEPVKQYEVLQEGIYTKESADEAFDWKNKLNHIITEHQYDSKYGILENWWIDEVEHLSKCDIGASRALELLECVKRKKVYNIDKSLKGHLNYWLDPSGKFHKVFGPSECGLSHFEWALNYIKENGIIHKDEGWETSSDYLEKLGFIRIQGWTKKVNFYTGKEPTLNQWNSLFDFCLVNEIEVPKWDSRFHFQ